KGVFPREIDLILHRTNVHGNTGSGQGSGTESIRLTNALFQAPVQNLSEDIRNPIRGTGYGQDRYQNRQGRGNRGRGRGNYSRQNGYSTNNDEDEYNQLEQGSSPTFDENGGNEFQVIQKLKR
ncbi:MAG: hypothetical protein EZS28_055429, partial [Streblomastix strix]